MTSHIRKREVRVGMGPGAVDQPRLRLCPAPSAGSLLSDAESCPPGALTPAPGQEGTAHSWDSVLTQDPASPREAPAPCPESGTMARPGGGGCFPKAPLLSKGPLLLMNPGG